MRWTQPVRGGDDGVLCLWLDKGRPVVAMTIFTFKGDDGNRVGRPRAPVALAPPLEGAWQGREMWHTRRPGSRSRPCPTPRRPPTPPRPASARCRPSSGDFYGQHHRQQELHLAAPRPHEAPLPLRGTGPEVVDGALFALVQGNDPEAFVLLEARPDGKATRWYYGLARLTDLRLRVRLKDREVFSVPYTNGRAGRALSDRHRRRKRRARRPRISRSREAARSAAIRPAPSEAPPMLSSSIDPTGSPRGGVADRS